MTAAIHARPIGAQLRLRARAARRRGPRPGRGFVIWVTLAIAALVPVAMIVLVTGDYRPLVVSTTSMRPALEPGDVVINEVIAPSEARVGDIVAYADELRGGAVVMERVVEVEFGADAYAFKTADDTGSHADAWTLAETDQLGRVAYRAPGLGRWVVTATSGMTGALLLIGLTALLVGAVVRPLRSVL